MAGVNIYGYANTNPLMYLDSDGRWVWVGVGAFVGGVLGGASGAFQAYIQGKDNHVILTAAFTGALSGAVGGGLVTINPFAGATIGGFLAGAGDAATQFSDTGCINMTEVVIQGGLGFAGGFPAGEVGKFIFRRLASTSIRGSAFRAAKFAPSGNAAVSTVFGLGSNYFLPSKVGGYRQ